MAPAKDLQGFVHSRNAGTNGTRPGIASGSAPDLTDLKFPTQPPTSNTAATRTKTQQHAGGRDLRSQSASEQHRRASNDREPFYATDGSAADETSTNPSTKRANTGAGRTQQHQTQANARHEDAEGSDSGESGDEDDESDEDLPSNPLRNNQIPGAPRITGQLDARLMAKMKKSKGGQSNGIASRYIQGDSYPTTTSGQPSVSDAGEKIVRGRPAQQNQAVPVAAQPQPAAYQSGNCVPLSAQYPAHARQPPQSAPEDQQSYTVQRPDGLFAAPKLDETSLAKEAGSGFSFGPKPPTKQQVTLRHAGSSYAQEVPKQSVQQQHSVSLNTAQQGSRPLVAEAPQPDIRHDTSHATKTSPDGVKQLLDHHAKSSRSKRQNRQSPPVQQQMPETAPEHDLISNPDNVNDPDLPNGFHPQDEQQEETPVRLDYDPPNLYTRDYYTLKNENFDTDPNAISLTLPNDMAMNALPQRLLSASRLHANDQATFLATLDIDQWEQAGDWFLDRFSDLVRRFKTARQDKRKTAREFEDEVERRHEAVSKKRKLTEDALGDMKASGAQVLQGTPKKARKTK